MKNKYRGTHDYQYELFHNRPIVLKNGEYVAIFHPESYWPTLLDDGWQLFCLYPEPRDEVIATAAVYYVMPGAD